MSDAQNHEASRLDVRTAESGAALTVTIAGELDFATAPELAEALDELDGSGSRPVVVDCSSVSFMDSSGLNVLVKAWSEANAGGAERFSVVNPAPQIRRVFEICGVTAMVQEWDS